MNGLIYDVDSDQVKTYHSLKIVYRNVVLLMHKNSIEEWVNFQIKKIHLEEYGLLVIGRIHLHGDEQVKVSINVDRIEYPDSEIYKPQYREYKLNQLLTSFS